MNKQIPRNIVSILLLFIVLLFSAGTSNAQHYPVQCNVQLIPPYSVHLADYYQGSNQKLLVNLTLKDLNHADLSVRLRISIEGQGIKLITKDDFIPKAPVLLQAGTPELLYGDRLEEYLAPEHMNFSGITQKQFLKTGRLPEGVYKFTVEVFEARRQEKVSNTATSMAWMLLNEPPVITAPANNKLLKATDPASIFFNWLPRHMNSQNALADVEYEFTMVEIWPVNQSAEEAIRSKEPLLKTVFRNTSFVYDAQYPMLVPGRQYACRVRAFSSQQKEMFKNEGYSPVVSFVFGEECKPPLMVDVDPALGGSAQLSIVPQSNHSSFTVQIRDVAGDKWYSQQSNQPDFELKQLKPGAAYQYKVQAQCETLESEFTPISQFSLSKEQAEVECGQSAAIPEIDGSPALNQLTAGDVINAGGFKVTVKQASGSRGTFTGSGVVRIGMLGNIELRTIFDNIKVNESYQLTAGEIRVVGSDIYALGSDIRDQADDFFNNDIWDSVDDAIADAESIVDEISNLQTDMGDNSLNNELEKAKRTIEKGRDKLAVGNKEGAQLVKEGADKVAQILDQVNSGDFQITANGIFFFAHSSQSYGFDSHDEGLTEEEKKAYLPYYQSLQLGDTTKQYYLKAWKSIGSNGNDVVNVKMQLSNGMKADTVHFMNAMGAEITPQKQGDAFSLNLRGSFHEDVQQITAYYNVKDDSTKNTKKVLLGALNVISYDQIEKNLVLVPVNGNSTSIPRAQLETYLNDTYSPANVRWTVSRHAGVQVEYSDDMSQGLDDGESKMLSNYTKEMNKVIKALKRSGDYDKHKTYVFLVDKAQTANKAGFMPKKRPWGFVFTNIHYNNSKALCRTIAHEVAHGEFRLSHPFQDFPSIPENSTQNLMDYADGQQLRKYQWDDIHNLRDVELWGQEEEGNAAIQNLAYGGYFDIKKEEWGNYGYLSPVGAAIIVTGATHLKFNEDGAVINFILNGKTYYGVHSVSSQRFLGYLSEDDKSMLTEHHLLTAEFEAEFNQKKFKGIEYLEKEKTIVAIAKKKYQKAYLDCTQKAFWKNQKQASNYTGIAKPPFIPDYAFVVDWKGSQCSDYEKDGVGNGVGVDVYLALINEISDEQKPELVELANYLTDLLKDKKFAFYGSGLEDIYMSGSFNPETLKYFRDNKIYSKVEFETQFPHQITKARYYDYIFSKKDLWAGIKPDYNSASTDYKIGGQYKYSLSDLITREKYFREENVFKTAILKFEENGNAQPISVKDGYDQDFARYGSDSALFGFTKYASSVAEAPMKAYMAYRFLPQLIAEVGIDAIMNKVIKEFGEEEAKRFIKGVAMEATMYYSVAELLGTSIDWKDFTLDVTMAGLRNTVYVGDDMQAWAACLQGIELNTTIELIDNIESKNINAIANSLISLSVQCFIPLVFEKYLGNNSSDLYRATQRSSATKLTRFFNKLKLSQAVQADLFFLTKNFDKIGGSRGVKWVQEMKRLIPTESGSRAYDLLVNASFDISKLSWKNFERLSNILSKFDDNAAKSIEDLFKGSLDVNRMLIYLEKSGSSLAQYSKAMDDVVQKNLFSGTMTLNGGKTISKLDFVKNYMGEATDLIEYYHKIVGGKQYFLKYHPASNQGAVIVIDTYTKVIADAECRILVNISEDELQLYNKQIIKDE